MVARTLVLAVFGLSIWLSANRLIGAHGRPSATSSDPVEAPKPQRRLDPPDAAAQARLRLLVRHRLANTLVDSAASAEPAEAFVLLLEARDIHARAGQVTSALGVVERIVERFRVDALALRTETIELTSSHLDGADGRRTVEMATEVMRDAVAQDRYDQAERLRNLAEAVALRTGQGSTAGELNRFQQELKSMQADFRATREARERLKTAPDDPRANRALGEYLCFSKGNWTDGLPYLRKGEGTAAELAGLDTADIPATETSLRIADGWWSLSEQTDGLHARNIRLRAQAWYWWILPELSGMSRDRAAKRADEPVDAGLLLSPPEWRERFQRPAQNAATNGRFRAWTVPAHPGASEMYMLVIEVSLPPTVTEYSLRDLSGTIEGSDRYRQPIGGRRASDRTLPVPNGRIQFHVMVPGAARLIRDRVTIRSEMLNEEKTLEILFE